MTIISRIEVPSILAQSDGLGGISDGMRELRILQKIGRWFPAAFV
jgi:hypothetical protein